MPKKKENAVKNINYKNKTVSKPKPNKMTDVDVQNKLYDNIIAAAKQEILDLSQVESLTSVSYSRDKVYNMLDMMSNDSIISAALELYATEATEPNGEGRIVWAESEDPKVLRKVESILESMSIDKNAYSDIYSLCLYGDRYWQMLREKEFNTSIANDPKITKIDLNDEEQKNTLNEDVIIKAYSKNDRYVDYLSPIKNPAEVYDLTEYGKSVGYVRTHIQPTKHGDDTFDHYDATRFNRIYDVNEIDIYPATEMVHASLSSCKGREDEQISITGLDEDVQATYNVKRGQSILYDSFKIWRELNLLENAVILNRLTRSSILRLIQVEVGDMDKDSVRVLLSKLKNTIEQKTALQVGAAMSEYTNTAPIENIIYVPTHDNIGAISASDLGGDVNVGDLNDLDYWKKKLFASLSIPGQFLGDTDDATGFNGGSSLTLISSRFAKRIKAIQNTYAQAITDAVNLELYDSGLLDYIGKFRIMMQAPTTQEDVDRRTNISNEISNIREIKGLLDSIQDQAAMLQITKSLLSVVISNNEVMEILDEQVKKLKNQGATADGNGSNAFGGMGGGDFGGDLGGDFGGDFGGEDIGGEEIPTEGPEGAPNTENGSEAITTNDAEQGAAGGPETASRGEEALNEKHDLPSFRELGISYRDVR